MKHFSKTLITTLFFVILMASCNEPNKKSFQKEKTKTVSYDSTFNHIRDSILNTIDYNPDSLQKYQTQYDAIQQELDSLTKNCTQAHKMNQEITTYQHNLLDQTIQNLNATLLKKHNLYLQKATPNFEKNAPNTSMIITYPAKRFQNNDADNPTFFPEAHIYDNIRLALINTHNDSIPSYLPTQILDEISQTEKKAHYQALKIAKKYSAYYPIADLHSIPQKYMKYIPSWFIVHNPDDNSYHINYQNIENFRNIEIIRNTYIPANEEYEKFFNDTTCYYQIINVTTNHITVKKQYKNGKAENKQINYDNQLWQYWYQSAPATNKITFTKLYTKNYSIIRVQQVIYSKSPNIINDTICDSNRDKTIQELHTKQDSISEKINHLTKLHNDATNTSIKLINKKLRHQK